MTAILVAFALLAALGGLLFMSQATVGVGLIAGGCLLAILARIIQADAQHRQTLARLPAAPIAPE